uniref:Uncharacterized protein n=1 Tax=Anguilla anguilla TaxID=7936 RepID=A0A0E9PA27_ANGAN
MSAELPAKFSRIPTDF